MVIEREAFIGIFSSECYFQKNENKSKTFFVFHPHVGGVRFRWIWSIGNFIHELFI